MWQKTRKCYDCCNGKFITLAYDLIPFFFTFEGSIVSYMYDNYINDFDYFYLCGDDVHLIVENLRGYLGVVEMENGKDKPVHLGHHVRRRYRAQFFVGGGPGYVLNKPALKLLVEEAFPVCFPELIVSSEDYHISLCSKQAGVELIDTADAVGRQRFIGVDSNWVATENPWETKSWSHVSYALWDEQGHGKRWGENVTSTQAVSFHNLKKPWKIKRHHAVLYKSCPLGTALGDGLAATS